MQVQEQDYITNFDWDAIPDTTSFLLPWTCGEWHFRTDAESGMRVLEHWACKDYQNCPMCAKAKCLEFKSRLLDILHSDKPIRVILHNSSTKELNEQYEGAKNVLHIPFNETDYFTLAESDGDEGQPLTEELVNKLARLGVAPKGKRISGGLGKKPTAPKSENTHPLLEEEENGRQEISRRVYKFVDYSGNNFEDEGILREVELKVIEKTKDLLPENATQVEEAIKTVEETNEEVAKEYGLEILFLYTENITIYESKIDWSRRLKWLENTQKTILKQQEFTT